MATAKPTIEEKIRTFYQAESGEWLMEKGKIKEARLLKEAVERIESLLATVDNLRSAKDTKDGLYHGWWKEEQKARRAIENAVSSVTNKLEAVSHFSEKLNETLNECKETTAKLATTMEEIENLDYED